MKIASNSNIIVHPQAEKLRERNRHLQDESVRLLVELDDLKNVVCPQIFAEYQVKIGALEWRAFQMDCETRAMLRRIEMAQAMLNRGDAPCYKCIEAEINVEFAAWQTKIEQQAREIKAAEDLRNLPLLSVEDSHELRAIYRKLAFLLHEDIAGNTDKRRRKLWLQAAEAYQCGDLRCLQTILLLIEDESRSEILETDILENLKKRNATLKQTCENFLSEIAEIKNSTPYLLHEILENPAEISRLQNALREKIQILRENRRQLVEHWAEIMRFAKDPENVEIPAEPPEIFDGENDNWAEIIY